MDIAEAVIVVGGVFVVDAALEAEARGGDVCDDPLLLPLGVGVLADGAGAQGERGIFFVARGQGGAQLGEDEGVGGKRVDVGKRQVAGAVEGEFDRVTRGRAGDGRVVVAALGALFLFAGGGACFLA
jgi:hypothetical protein